MLKNDYITVFWRQSFAMSHDIGFIASAQGVIPYAIGLVVDQFEDFLLEFSQTSLVEVAFVYACLYAIPVALDDVHHPKSAPVIEDIVANDHQHAL